MVEITSEFNLMRILWWKDSKTRTMNTSAGPKCAYNFLWMLTNWLLNVTLDLSFIPLIWFLISLSFLHHTIFAVSTIMANFKTYQVEILSSELGSWHWWLKIWEQMKRWAVVCWNVIHQIRRGQNNSPTRDCQNRKKRPKKFSTLYCHNYKICTWDSSFSRNIVLILGL